MKTFRLGTLVGVIVCVFVTALRVCVPASTKCHAFRPTAAANRQPPKYQVKDAGEKKPTPPQFTARLADGTVVGELVLGSTRQDQALRLFSKPNLAYYQEMPRPPTLPYPVARIGKVTPKPKAVFHPWRSMYYLYFDENKTLVTLMEMGDPLEGKSRNDMLDTYPDLKTTGHSRKRRPPAYEMQAEIAPNVVLVLIFDEKTNKVIAVAYAYTGDSKGNGKIRRATRQPHDRQSDSCDMALRVAPCVPCSS